MLVTNLPRIDVIIWYAYFGYMIWFKSMMASMMTVSMVVSLFLDLQQLSAYNFIILYSSWQSLKFSQVIYSLRSNLSKDNVSKV
jgi:hypothetical protein